MMMMKNVSNKPLNNTRTFVLNKSPSMDLQTPPQLPSTSKSYVPKKSPLQQLELAASPQLVVGEEILHFGHPQHPLSKLNLPDRFTCSGCKEHGAGKRYTCQQCDFQLHDFCALPPSALCRNPFHYQHQLVFYSKPVKAGIVQSKCDVCSKPIKGYAYRCSPCNFQMHPCCSMLTGEMKIQTHTHTHTLKLLSSASSSSSSAAEIAGACGECKRRRSGRMYHCSVCDYHVHAVCAKDMMNGLHENGHSNKGKDKASVLGAAARLASQVVVDFIGGIMEGIGEGVGEAFVQNIARSSPPATTARPPTPNPTNNHLIHTSNPPLLLSRRSVRRN
ncbi:uncharacterized protein LOC107404556 [Ziziphus jujuba]|uniref:Uncharacterized protein LOC107404556 n=1 Tax=Ziziphus jujuba TaxID=326968 RepID=A0A6P3YTN0_ZIZJJ|nr:uncharacterized protein LOC107404556 [Ziziphus jujuba]